MEHHVVIGTAGHVDHGKTELVKALTGIDTDRWAEEKRRGITIDLGFAELDLGAGRTASIVDVPGHEDFVRNMVAGATGVDVALMVVAADEGVMPQTEEHMAVLEFLAVQTGVVAITKCDLVEDDWVALVEDDVCQRLAASSIAWQHVVRCSAVTGQGTETLRSALADSADKAKPRSVEDLFRLPVDRVFSVAGAGTVVTGTTWSGTVTVGDEVRVLPVEAGGGGGGGGAGGSARVRGIEVHGTASDMAQPGRRTALALAGISRQEIERGHNVVSGPWWRATNAVDVLITLLPDARPLTQRTRVRFHLGTAEVMARVTPAEVRIEPGIQAAARLRLEAPMVCRWGDLGVIRSYSPVTTIGGCVVADPFPAARPRRPVGLRDRAQADPTRRLAAFVSAAGSDGLDTVELPVRLGVPPTGVSALVEAADGVVWVGERLYAAAQVDSVRDATLAALAEYHKLNPLEPGMPREVARRTVKTGSLADYVHGLLRDEGLVAVEGGGQSIRLASHQATLSGDQVETARALTEELVAAGIHGRTVAELVVGTSPEETQALLGFLVREGALVRVGRDRYYHKEALDKLIGTIVQEIRGAGRVTPAELRDATGLSRKYLIPLLEWLDGRSITLRVGDARELGPAAESVGGVVDSR